MHMINGWDVFLTLLCYNHVLIHVHAGFRRQTSRIPLRFFEEKLADNKEIVFTGIEVIPVYVMSIIIISCVVLI